MTSSAGRFSLKFEPFDGLSNPSRNSYMLSTKQEAKVAIRTPEESARFILAVFKYHNCRPGDVLGASVISGHFSGSDWRDTDRAAGLKFAAEQGWIKLLDANGTSKFTQIGFDEAY
jgi:hypothetical protein